MINDGRSSRRVVLPTCITPSILAGIARPTRSKRSSLDPPTLMRSDRGRSAAGKTFFGLPDQSRGPALLCADAGHPSCLPPMSAIVPATSAPNHWVGTTTQSIELPRDLWTPHQSLEDSPLSVDPAAIETVILRLLDERGPGKTVSPTEAARALGGSDPAGWGPLMQPVRQVAVRLAREGRVVIIRKGKPVDPSDFKGVYRLRLPRHDGEIDP
jgi:hypothetical protein